MHDVPSRTDTDQEEEVQKPSSKAWYVLVVLTLVYALSFMDRKLPFILVEAIKEDLNLSDTQIGLLTGLMFAFVYSVSAIPLGVLADRLSRKRVIAACIAVWTSLTALGGLSQNFFHLAAARMGLALGEAGFTPASHSMIADYFPAKFRGRAMGLYFVGAQLGILLGLGLGGWISDIANWRIAMFLCGLPGIIFVAVILLTFKEPKRQKPSASGHISQPAAPGIIYSVKSILGQKALAHLFAAGVLFTFTMAATNAFSPAYIMRTYSLSATQTGISYGLVVGIAGSIGAIGGGIIGDKLRASNPAKSLYFVAAAMLVAAPFLMLALFSKNYLWFLIFVFVPQAAAMTYAGPSFSTLQALTSPRMHGVASAIFLFSLSGIGAAFGPVAAGALSDYLATIGIHNTLRWSMLAMTLPMIWAALHFALAGRAVNAKASDV